MHKTQTIYNTTIQVPQCTLQAKFCMQQIYNCLQSKLRCNQYFDINQPTKICMQTMDIGCMQHFNDTACTTR